ncbi:MAG: dTDP-4-dehydrorhamnose 3,5-epimerase [Bacteroidia bacterium]|nr:dTDP-4-dehydrorhamnose 3,5-epimerase [Bacteroidia bacterium]
MAQFKKLPLAGLLLITPKIFTDSRGHFFESFNAKEAALDGVDEVFVQDNESVSSKHVIRGLHFQNPPFGQAKLIRVVNGAVLDVVVDIRKSSATYGKHFAIELNAANKLMLYIPQGFAHGFLSLTDDTVFQYKCSNYWHKEAESGINYADSKLNIQWPVAKPIVSEKDLILPCILNTVNLFK